MADYKIVSMRDLLSMKTDAPAGVVFLCQHCETTLDPSWKYCPYCGKSTGLDFKLKG